MLSLLLLAVSIVAEAQTYALQGTVTDKSSGEPLPGVSVSVRQKGSKVIRYFARTDADGRYTINAERNGGEREIVFSMIGFESITIPLRDGISTYDAVLAGKDTQLKEVIVKAPAITAKGDTILYNVARYAGINDRTIADVLKKMPGIDVAENGAISYNGQQINKFYIEGKDMLDGRYSIATNTIHQEDVATVEVMENHQPMKVLQDVSFSQDPAINLRLKSTARSRWAGTVKAGGGISPGVWTGELSLMRFAKNAQTLNTYKTNNTGENVAAQTDNLYARPGGYALRSFINIRPPVLGTLDSRRSRFNRTHVVSTNNMLKLSGDYDITVNAHYTNNILTADASTETTYFMNDGSNLSVTESEHNKLTQNILTAETGIKANTKTLFLENKLKANIGWNGNVSADAGSYPNRSAGSVTDRSVTDRLHVIRRYGRHIVELHSNNAYMEKPVTLTVSRDDGSIQHQRVRQAAFSTDTYASYGITAGRLSVSAKAGVNGLLRNMRSEAEGLPEELHPTGNDTRMNLWRIYMSPEADFMARRFKAKLSVPLSYTFYRFKDNAAAKQNSKSRPSAGVSLATELGLTPDLKIYLNGSHAQLETDEQSFFNGLIMTDYRNLHTGKTDYGYGSYSTAMLSLTFDRPLSAFFSRFSASHSWQSMPWITSRTFAGIYIINGFEDTNSTMRSWRVAAQAAKGVDAIKGTFTLDAAYGKSQSHIFQNNERADYVTADLSIEPRVELTPAAWLNIRYGMEFRLSQLNMHTAAMSQTTEHIAQRLTCKVRPLKSWTLTLSAEHYINELADGSKKQTLLADAEIIYNSGIFEVTLSATNIFNRKHYSYRTYDSGTSLFHQFRIRPRNIMLSIGMLI